MGDLMAVKAEQQHVVAAMALLLHRKVLAIARWHHLKAPATACGYEMSLTTSLQGWCGNCDLKLEA